MQIRRINQKLFAVESESQDKSYTVNLEFKSCSCPDHSYRNNHCKHLRAVDQYVAALAGPQVDLSTHTCTCKEFTDRRDGKRIGVLFVTCAHLQAARKAASEPPANAYTRAAERARVLDDAALWQSLERYPAGPVAGAIRMELARRANEQPEPKPLPTGVMELLAGATPAEVERALAVYGR